MGFFKASNRLEHSNRRSPRDAARSGFPLNLAADANLSNALRGCEDAFNEDVLPSDAELKAPREFYTAIVSARPSCAWEQESKRKH
ncbi:hypothetical protein [Bradyrhizobium sp. SZCCHNPS1003]|uniref:hypothetical protein n=1 Tax=Bradyrhizobium sp. SZCCHNPS1003 TaxID=3057330 RepID=UPI0028F12A87|nr:hypothetical protein [Bradyrhizobium sp. SZCCHNPS1003]